MHICIPLYLYYLLFARVAELCLNNKCTTHSLPVTVTGYRSSSTKWSGGVPCGARCIYYLLFISICGCTRTAVAAVVCCLLSVVSCQAECSRVSQKLGSWNVAAVRVVAFTAMGSRCWVGAPSDRTSSSICSQEPNRRGIKYACVTLSLRSTPHGVSVLHFGHTIARTSFARG